MDYGIKVSQSGVDVKTAQPYELEFSSEYFNFKEMAAASGVFKTGNANPLSNDTPAGQNYIRMEPPASALVDYSPTGVIAIYNGSPGDYEYVKYATISGNTFTNCTRGYWGTTDKNHSAGCPVTPALTRREIYGHSLGYYPVVFCAARNDTPAMSHNTYPLPFCGPYWAFYYYITSTKVWAILWRNGALYPPGGDEDWTIFMKVMYDKIKS